MQPPSNKAKSKMLSARNNNFITSNTNESNILTDYDELDDDIYTTPQPIYEDQQNNIIVLNTEHSLQSDDLAINNNNFFVKDDNINDNPTEMNNLI